MAEEIVGTPLRVGVVNREREATAETPTWNVVIVTTGIARRWLQDDLIGDNRTDDGTLRGEDPADPVAVIDVPPAPTVSTSREGRRWTFDWRLDDPREGDEFKIVMSGDGAVQTEPEYTRDTSRTLTVARNATVCIQVSLSRVKRPSSA